MVKYQHQMAEGDPHAVPVRDAATVMVLADRPELEVLMVQRTSRAAFGATAWVFPGGRVDPDDQAGIDHVASGLTDAEASAQLGVRSGGRAWWLAAVRETVEEAGLLLATRSPAPSVVSEVRAAAHGGAPEFLDALARHGLRLDLGTITEVARFITPVGPPRRFDTRFFVARAPERQSVVPDESEIVGAQWIRPAEAIERWRAGALPLMSVTHRMLACLDRYESVEEVLDTASRRPPSRRVRVNDPEGAYEVLLPGEPGYESADLEVEHGEVRL